MANDANRGREGEVRQADPNHAATDPKAAAQQERTHRDHDRLEQSARDVESSVSSAVRDTPIQPMTQGPGSTTFDTSRGDQAATDPRAAAQSEQVHRDHDRLQESARRVQESVPASVRDTPVQPARNSDDDNR